MGNIYDNFKGVSTIGAPLLMNELENNLKAYLDWSLLGIGAFTNVYRATSGYPSGDMSRLRPVFDLAYSSGTVWQGIRKDWVWETGVEYKSSVVGAISGIAYGTGNLISFVNADDIYTNDIITITNCDNPSFNQDLTITNKSSTLKYFAVADNGYCGNATTGTYQKIIRPVENIKVYIGGVLQNTGNYYINYPLGWVVLNTGIPVTSNVQASYSYRNVQVYKADSVPWWQQIQFESLDATNLHFTQVNNFGEWSIGGQHRIQLPAVIIESVARGRSTPYEMGNSALWIYQDMLIHILAESRFERNQLVDICRYQEDKDIWLYNTQSIAANGQFTLDYRGMRVGSKMYPDLVAIDGFRWKLCIFDTMTVSEIAPLDAKLFQGVIRLTTKTVLGDIS